MTLTENQLREMFPHAGSRLAPHLPYINPAMAEGQIDSAKRISAFLAQLAHESGEYRYMEEIADGSAYEGRTDLGNVYPGDGKRFKGHGPIQITGRANHAACGAALGLDLVNHPELITFPEHGTRSAVWFWTSRGLNTLADANWFPEITRRINGGYNGWDDRVAHWLRNREVLGLPAPPEASLEPSNRQVRQFQSDNGLYPDGVVGPRTISRLEDS